MTAGDPFRSHSSEQPMLAHLRRRPPADGLLGLRRKLARTDSAAHATGFIGRVFIARPNRAVYATVSAMVAVVLSIAVIHEYRAEPVGEDAAVARSLSDQLQWAKQPLPAGVVDTGAADAFEVDTGNPKVRFYWMITKPGSDDG